MPMPREKKPGKMRPENPYRGDDNRKSRVHAQQYDRSVERRPGNGEPDNRVQEMYPGNGR